MRDLFNDYIAGSPDLLAFYANPPKALFDEAPQAAPWDPALADALRQYQERLGGTASFKGNEPVIITGQQSGLFTGPLYTIYKAVTAVILARKLQERWDTPCVPVFWVGSEDHDFEEVRTAHFLTKHHTPLALEYTPSGNIDGFPMYRVPLNASVHAFIDEAAAETAGSDYREEMAAFLHETLDASASLADWTARLVARLFRHTPLVVFAPHMPEARHASATVFEKEIEDPLKSTDLLNEAGTRLDRIGFPPQVLKGETECNFFLEMGDRRRKVLFEKDHFRLPEEDICCSVDDIRTLLDASPERFSPNVALRCIVQQHLFPVAAYVAGPGELAYWAQLKPLFDHFGMPMPIVYPRARCALTTIKLNKLRAKLGLELEDLGQHQDGLLERALRHTAKNPAYDFAQSQRKAIETALADLAGGIERHDKTAATMAENLARDVSGKLDRLERTILQRDEAKIETVRKQLERLCNSLAPGTKPQERVYNIFSFLFEHGWDLIPRLIDELDVESFTMNEIEL